MTPRTVARRRAVRERAPRYTISTTGSVVVDASIAFLWFANQPDRWGALRLLEEGTALIAPDLMATEVANAWWKSVRRHEMQLADVEEAVTHLLETGIQWVATMALLRSAVRLASELDHPVYDCVYLTVAATYGAPLATADERLRAAAKRIGIRLWT